LERVGHAHAVSWTAPDAVFEIVTVSTDVPFGLIVEG